MVFGPADVHVFRGGPACFLDADERHCRKLRECRTTIEVPQHWTACWCRFVLLLKSL